MSTAKSVDFLFNQMRNATGALAGGSITFYSAGTTSLKAVYLDRDMTTEAVNPYTLSADGTAELFASGIYRVVIKTSAGVTVYDYDNVEIIAAAAAIADGSTYTVVQAISGDQTYELATVYHQFISKNGNTAYTITITAPVGYTFADGTTEYVIYNDNETVEFLKYGTEFFLVS